MNEIERAVVAALQSDSGVMAIATEICYGAGDIDTKFPFVVLFKQPITDSDRYSFTERTARLQRYVVKAVDGGMSKQRAQQLADAVDAVLTDSQLVLSGWAWLHCHRIGDIEYSESLVDGTIAWHVGGVYEIILGRMT